MTTGSDIIAGLEPAHRAAAPAEAAKAQPAAGWRSIRLAEVDWSTVIWIGMIHVVALGAAPFTFTWQGLVVAIALAWLTGCVGITLGFHRLLTHKSFETSPAFRRVIAFIGGLAGEGSAIHWVSDHRRHHAHSDKPGDPHSPRDGAWWSHMLWFVPKVNRDHNERYHRRWVPDLMRDPVFLFLDRTFILWHIALGVGLYFAGHALGGAAMGWSLVVWGMFVRLLFVLHTTWLVNSATHMWGYRNYEVDDDSRNCWWVALLTHGEGWHNNHHAYPRMARHGHRWWELDTTYALIRVLRRVGLVRDVIDQLPERGESAAA
jgi:stearoyl-CoA desaturase (delta-9 desaturase)